MTKEYKRILAKKKSAGLTWDELAKAAGIKVSTWMTGVSYAKIPDSDIEAIAPVLHTTYDWLKYGKEPEWVEETTSKAKVKKADEKAAD
jgi:transcriptional regulator with XRE-family HTH domain